MDYRQVAKEQIELLQGMQKEMLVKRANDAAGICKIAETILLLCKEIKTIPSSK